MDDIKFKRLDHTWSQKLLDLQKTIFKEILDKYHDDAINPANEDLATFKAKVIDRDIVFGIFDKQNLVGFMAIREEASSNRFCRIGLLNDVRGRGIAQKALKLAFEHLNNGKPWELSTIQQQSNLLHLYGKMGFKRVEDKDCIVNDKMTLIIMRKEN